MTLCELRRERRAPSVRGRATPSAGKTVTTRWKPAMRASKEAFKANSEHKKNSPKTEMARNTIALGPQPLLSSARALRCDGSSSIGLHSQQHSQHFAHLQARMHPGMSVRGSTARIEKMSSAVAASLISLSLLCTK